MTRRSLLAAPAALAIGACSHPKATGFRGYCFVANEAGRSVGVVDLTRFRMRKRIPLDGAPSEVVAHPSEPKALALARDTGTVYEIDAVKLAVSRHARGGNTAVAMQVSAQTGAVWVLYRDPASLVEIPLKTMRPERRIRLSAAPSAFDLNGKAAVVASAEQRTLTLASLASASVERTVTAADEPTLVQFRKDGQHVFAASGPGRALSIYEAASGKTVVRLPLPIEPRQMTIKPDGGQLFLTGAGLDAVVVVYVYETQIAETLLAGRAPGAMAAMDTPGYLMAANPETNSVTILDLENNGRLVAQVQVGQAPGAIVLTPPREAEDQYALVLNEKSGDLAVIRLKSLPQTAEARRRPTPIFALVPVGERPVSAAVMSFT